MMKPFAPIACVFAAVVLSVDSAPAQRRSGPQPSPEALAEHARQQVIEWTSGGPSPSAELPIREPADGDVLTSIAFGSCGRENRPQPIWQAVLQQKPDLFIFLGDNAYLDTTQSAVMREKYSQQAAIPGFEELVHSTPVMATWDDHDYGLNDAGSTFSHKQLGRVAFLDFWQVPADDSRRNEDRAEDGGGIYHSRITGPAGKRVQTILLDTRWNRDDIPTTRVIGATGRVRTQYLPNTDPKSTLLGEKQWAWLEEQLRQPAEVRLIASSIQVVPEEHPFEKWANFPHERERLYRLIRETSASGVLFLSGDRHFAELSVESAGVGYPMFDFTSSGLTQAARFFRHPEPNRHRIACLPAGNHFGLVRIDWKGAETKIRLDCIDEAGDVAFGHTIPLALLQFGTEQEAARFRW